MAQPALAIDPAPTVTLCCSMCGKDSNHVRSLMAGGAGGHLCDACTVAAMKIVINQCVRDLARRH